MIDHLLSMDQLDHASIVRILDTADNLRSVTSRTVPKLPTLRGRTICNLFYEASTRTRVSFELAAKRLSADVANLTADARSSVSKGESFKDTALTLQAMGVDAIVVRHPTSGAPLQLSRWVDATVVNAGDGAHEHPTQGLLDLFTIRERFKDLNGLEVAIVGDALNSRVARSTVKGLITMGAKVVLVGPPTLVPESIRGWGTEVSCDFDAVVDQVDVCYMLRVQRERLATQAFPSLGEYSTLWGLTRERAARLKPDAVVMHPGPVNRGVEIAGDVVEHPRSIILDQVANGVVVRMALLYLMLGGNDTIEDAR